MRVYHQGILYRFTMKYVMTACYNGILRAYAVKICHQKRRDGIFSRVCSEGILYRFNMKHMMMACYNGK